MVYHPMRRIFRSESMHYLLSVKAYLGIWESWNLGTGLRNGKRNRGEKINNYYWEFPKSNGIGPVRESNPGPLAP